MIRAATAALAAALALASPAPAAPAGEALATCGAMAGETVSLLYRVRFLDRSGGWAVRDAAGRRTVLREECVSRPGGAFARHRCGPARGARVSVLRYAGVLANRVDPHPLSLTALYEIAFLDAEGRVQETPETELTFRSCLALDAGERWPEPQAH